MRSQDGWLSVAHMLCLLPSMQAYHAQGCTGCAAFAALHAKLATPLELCQSQQHLHVPGVIGRG